MSVGMGMDMAGQDSVSGECLLAGERMRTTAPMPASRLEPV
jgi:hypothetical protein